MGGTGETEGGTDVVGSVHCPAVGVGGNSSCLLYAEAGEDHPYTLHLALLVLKTGAGETLPRALQPALHVMYVGAGGNDPYALNSVCIRTIGGGGGK